jgi:hypothetical protein
MGDLEAVSCSEVVNQVRWDRFDRPGLLLPELLGSALYRTHKSARDQRKCWSVGYGASLIGCLPSGMRSCERQVDARR